jgi:hypothetical protein
MEESGTPPKLRDDRLGHEDGTVQARYSQVTPEMKTRFARASPSAGRLRSTLVEIRSMRSAVSVMDQLLANKARY